MSKRPLAPLHPKSRSRRSLTHVGGAIEVEGEPEAASALAHALDVPVPTHAEDATEEEEGRSHVHGFHTYPARMHPVTAARLVTSFAPPRGMVLDPFCGSGTVLVEAMLAGRNAMGTDLNPIALQLSRLKTQRRSRAELEELVEAAQEIAQHAERRRKSRAGASKRLPPEDVELFAPHTLLELDSLRDGIAYVGRVELRQALSLVLSSLLVKLSKRRGDTSVDTEVRRIAAGYPAKLFVRKTEELARRIADFSRALPSPSPRATVAEDDATRLSTLHPRSIDAVITSPPYVATYDYIAHHAMRLRWLGLDATKLERGEIGARRRYGTLTPEGAALEWERELAALLGALARVVVPAGYVVLLMADSAVARTALRADEFVAKVAAKSPFAPVARASQKRPHFHGPTAAAFRDAPRAEHVLLLRRS